MPQDRDRDADRAGPPRRPPGSHRRDGRGVPGRRAALAARAAVAVVLGTQILAMLLVGTYTRREPRVGGVPFFYWYSLMWLVIGALGMAASVWLLARFAAPSTAAGTAGAAGAAGADGPAGRDAHRSAR
ncbi:conserved hypothetical protein [Frankia canadensis]|uniref:Integral membrane protein n=1 Tax=Frankia canadensis TaxID=1836972 RepID=A0A2I2KKP8_9ACTN|nr:DUF3311 domain-containing protein [Frankia canadensis]SNQ46250.1 conserved hypothetical protein [Frankia canadensis]SOU53540.1 conserved hypothetical protein [Frankia canadensis]